MAPDWPRFFLKSRQMFEISVDRVRVVLGDTALPETGETFGSSATIGVGSAVHDAAAKLKARVMDLSGSQFGPNN